MLFIAENDDLVYPKLLKFLSLSTLVLSISFAPISFLIALVGPVGDIGSILYFASATFLVPILLIWLLVTVISYALYNYKIPLFLSINFFLLAIIYFLFAIHKLSINQYSPYQFSILLNILLSIFFLYSGIVATMSARPLRTNNPWLYIALFYLSAVDLLNIYGYFYKIDTGYNGVVPTPNLLYLTLLPVLIFLYFSITSTLASKLNRVKSVLSILLISFLYLFIIKTSIFTTKVFISGTLSTEGMVSDIRDGLYGDQEVYLWYASNDIRYVDLKTTTRILDESGNQTSVLYLSKGQKVKVKYSISPDERFGETYPIAQTIQVLGKW